MRISKPVIFCLAAAALFGAAAPAAKMLVAGTGPFTLAGLFYLGAAIVVAPAAWRSGVAAIAWRERNLAKVAGVIIAGGVVAPTLLMMALRTASAASVSLWLNFETIATTALAWTIFREHIGGRALAAMLLVAGAGVMLAASSSPGSAEAGFMIAAACLLWGLDNNLTSVIDGLTPAQLTMLKGAIGGGINLAIGLTTERARLAAGPLTAALVIGAFSYGASLVLYIQGAQSLGAARSQMLFASAPFLGCILAWSVLREPVEMRQAAAILVIAAALAILFSDREHGHAHFHSAVTHTHEHSHDDVHHAHEHADRSLAIRHTHPHSHYPIEHEHSHLPDLHHRHEH